MTLTLAPKQRSYQGIRMLNMKALSLTTQQLWPIFKFFADKGTNRVMEQQTGQKLPVYAQNAPDLSMLGHNNLFTMDKFPKLEKENISPV